MDDEEEVDGSEQTTGTYAVELVEDGRTTGTVAVAADETILEATARSDTDVRYGCREGRCVSCTGRLLEGAVDYAVEPHALDDDQRDRGFVLLCIAHPRDDCRVEVGRRVLEDAFPRLWPPEGGF
jgi:ferredoxin